jgi:penicillin-binding protein 2
MRVGRPHRHDNRRITLLAVGLAAGFLAIGSQLAYLQLVTGDYLAALSDKNRIRLRTVTAPRGILFDRNRLPLVENRPAFTLAVVPREADDLPAVLDRLARLLNLPAAELHERFARIPRDSPWPVRVQRGLTLEEVARVEEWKPDLPGVTVDVDTQRAYPSTRFAAHLLGYVREVSEADLARTRFRRGDLVGQSGLERLYDQYLRGRDGAEETEVDAHGRPIRVLARQEPVAGANVHTTIDRRIQEAAEQALGPRNGAIVVMDPRTGDLLALVSNPAFPVERFTGPIDRETWLSLVEDPGRPLLNRAIQGEYQPGSVFKVVVAAAALQAQVFTPFDRLSCPREWWFGGRAYHNWEDHDRGALTMAEALKHSCNTFFYQLGLKVGPERIGKMAEEFGLGRGTGSGLIGERPGLVPSPAWKKRVWKDKWHAGDTVSLAIGQGLITVTPLQTARFMAAVANGGILYKPRMVVKVVGADGTPQASEAPVEQGRVEAAPVVLDFLRQALWAIVNDGGTGKGAMIPGLGIAGKTGTAQTREFKSDAERKRRDQDNAWFAAFAPVEDPQVVVVVFAERAGLGGQVAAPIAKEIFKAIFLEKVAAAGLSG